MEKQSYKTALILMVLHALLVVIWNVAGIWLLSEGRSALGPTATLTGALLFAVLIAIYLYAYQKEYEYFFLVIVAFGALLGTLAIYGAFTKDPALWPSEFWRYAGVAVNTLGILGFMFAVKAFYKSDKNKIS